jgi:uncharacterized membrane protein
MKKPNYTLGQRAADKVTEVMGSWKFIFLQSGLIFAWILYNLFAKEGFKFDEYPFILLNLMMSFQAAYAAPMIMMSAKREAEIDRLRQIEDFKIDRSAKQKIEEIQIQIANLKQHLDGENHSNLSEAIENLENIQENLG